MCFWYVDLTCGKKMAYSGLFRGYPVCGIGLLRGRLWLLCEGGFVCVWVEFGVILGVKKGCLTPVGGSDYILAACMYICFVNLGYDRVAD
jgi:hypothetical protein